MKNIIKTSKFLSVTLDDGTMCITPDTSKEFLDKIKECQDDAAIYALFNPEDADNAPSEVLKDAFTGEFTSKYVTFNNDVATIPSISNLSVPQNFVEAILQAEKDGNEEVLTTYLNFWTLVSLNPDAKIRKNLFWFVRKWDVKITRSGLLVAYRNAHFKNENGIDRAAVERITKDYLKIKGQKQAPKNYHYESLIDEDGNELMPLVNHKKDDSGAWAEGDNVMFSGKTLEELYKECISYDNTVSYTDGHTHTFDIRIGTPVSMPREDCDASDATCSRGLHAAARGWLKENYYGDTGLVVLVNPAMVVNCPPEDGYGKLRCCEYLPIGTMDYDENGNLQEDVVSTGFEDEYLLDYAGKINSEDLDNFTIYALRSDGINRDAILKRIQDIADHTERYV